MEDELPSVEAYKEALQIIKGGISLLQMGILRAQFLAPNHTLTAGQMAKAVGYREDQFQIVNSQYGRLGTKLREALDYHTGEDELKLWVFSEITGREQASDHWLLRMREPVVQALEELGWFSEKRGGK